MPREPETRMKTELPALLMTNDMKRRLAKEQVQSAISNIKTLGALAGISDRSLFEFMSLAKFMENELAKEKFTK